MQDVLEVGERKLIGCVALSLKGKACLLTDHAGLQSAMGSSHYFVLSSGQLLPEVAVEQLSGDFPWLR